MKNYFGVKFEPIFSKPRIPSEKLRSMSHFFKTIFDFYTFKGIIRLSRKRRKKKL
jgi:hypothetical protein